MIRRPEACALAAVSGRVGDDSFEACRGQGLHISTHTVNTHLRQVFAKLGVSNQVAFGAVVHHSIE